MYVKDPTYIQAFPNTEADGKDTGVAAFSAIPLVTHGYKSVVFIRIVKQYMKM